jgi:hypothetical protein
MLLLDAPPTAAPSDAPDRARVVRSERGMSSVLRLPNGAEVPLSGITAGMYYPPNYLEDLRAGRL